VDAEIALEHKKLVAERCLATEAQLKALTLEEEKLLFEQLQLVLEWNSKTRRTHCQEGQSRPTQGKTRPDHP
jgi:hypothetical protein